MNQVEYHMGLPCDLSGSRSKNRFRLELLWGISRMLELMESANDFTIVFDLVCDIEVHLDNGFEFYQIKTHKESQPKYTAKSLVKVKEGEQGSILGKLFVLNTISTVPVKTVLVCNAPFKALSSEPGENCLDSLSQSNKSVIIEAIKKELGTKDVDLSNSYYLYTPMNLLQPENEIKGQLMATFEKVKGSEPVNPNALYRLVFDAVSEKACYEFDANDYEQIKKFKGISRNEFDRMLDAHLSNEKTGINQTRDYINQIKGIHEKKSYKDALNSLLPKMARSRVLQNMEIMMAKTLMEYSEISDVEEAIDILTDSYHDKFPVEYSNAEKTVCYMIVIHKYVEGGYDNEINI